MDAKERRLLDKTLNFRGHRGWFEKKVQNPALLRVATEALDAYERTAAVSKVTADDIAPIVVAAESARASIREMGVQMLVLLGLDWRCACDVLLNLVSHRNGKIRWTVITQVPYWVTQNPVTYPVDFILAFLQRGITDRIAKNRLFAYEGARKFYRPELLPELRAALTVETDREVVAALKDAIAALERGFFGAGGWFDTLPPEAPIWIYMADGTFAAASIPWNLSPHDAAEKVKEIRTRLETATTTR